MSYTTGTNVNYGVSTTGAVVPGSYALSAVTTGYFGDGPPSISFSSSPNTGTYLSNANTYGFLAGGAERGSISTTAFTSKVRFIYPNGGVGTPGTNFSTAANTGLYRIGNNFNITANATQSCAFTNSAIQPQKPIRAIDGSASAPSYSFALSTGLGIYWSSANVMGIAAVGTDVGAWSATGLYVGPTGASSTSSTTGCLTLAGGLGIAKTTNASSATNGGTLTSAGGGAFAQDLYVGGKLQLTGTTYTQLTNNTTGVIANTQKGFITTAALLPANTLQTFTLTNSYITTSTAVLLAVGQGQRAALDAAALPVVYVTNKSAGACDINMYSAAGSTNPVSLQFIVV